MPLPPAFPANPPHVHFFSSSTMNQQAAALLKDRRFKRMSVSVVDLTRRIKLFGAAIGLNFASGWDEGTTRYGASLVKIAAMLAAFRLRKNFREAVKGVAAKDADDLINKVTTDWKQDVEDKAKGAKSDFPALKKIFTIGGSSGAWSVEFERTFLKKMKEMIDQSSNTAASYCILALGYKYINGALISEGLYVPGAGGLWLAGDYSSGGDSPAEPKSGSHQAASAAAVVQFLTLLETDRMLDRDSAACKEMRNLMRNPFFTRFLAADGRSFTRFFGKLGIGVDGTRHDGCVVEREVGGKTTRYAVCILGATHWPDMVALGLRIDELVLAEHGLTP